MKLKRIISLMWIKVSFIYVVLMIGGTVLVIKKYESETREREEGKITALVYQYMENKRESLMKISTSHSYWTELRESVLVQDDSWIVENASEYLLEGYGVDLVYIASQKGGYEGVWGPISGDEVRKKGIGFQGEGSSLILLGEDIYLLCWSSITDNEIKNPVGIYVVGTKVQLEEITEFLRIFSFISVGVKMAGDRGSNFGMMLPLNNEISLMVDYKLPAFEGRIREVFIYIMSGTVLLALLLFAVFMRYINKISDRISKIVKRIERISRGEYYQSVPLGESDEAALLSDSINNLSETIRDKIYKAEESYNDSLRLLVKVVEVNDCYTKGHSERVAFFSRALGEKVGYPELDLLEQGALLHDIGKVAIPQNILNKRGKLTDSEYEVIKKHSETGEKVLRVVESFSNIRELVLYHHERMDGGGYPRSLKGEEIPLGARIIAVADVFDALISERPYRRAMDLDEALDILRKEGESKLDSMLVEEFLEIAEAAYEEGYRNASKREKILERLRKVSIEGECQAEAQKEGVS